MSAYARYSTLLKNTVAIYAATEENRATLLHTGLNEIVSGIGPMRPADWEKVRMDSAIILRIWATGEANEAANEVQQQLLAFLDAQAVAQTQAPVPAFRPNDPILHIKEYPSDDEDDIGIHKIIIMKQPTPPTPAPAPAPAPARLPPNYVVQGAVAPAPALPIKPESEEEEEVEEVEEEEEEVEEVEEVEEEEEEVEEEEDEVEVAPIKIRGRDYWIDKKSNKLYANEEGDEVGEEVGALRDGKPVFLAK